MERVSAKFQTGKVEQGRLNREVKNSTSNFQPSLPCSIFPVQSSLLLEVSDLRVTFRAHDGALITPVRGVSFNIRHGECVVLAGESGCGKSLTAMAIAKLPPTDQALVAGRVTCHGKIACVFQDPAASLNPIMRVGKQIAEALKQGSTDIPVRGIDDEIIRLLARVKLPASAARAYPFELSGGMQQRAMLAMALALRPALLIADEPTTALDVLMQKEVLDLIDEIAADTGMGVLLITHHLALAAGRADRINILYAGQIVESGPVAEVLNSPLHPYTRGLSNAIPRLNAPPGERLAEIPGVVPDPRAPVAGCPFLPRCNRATKNCHAEQPLREFPNGRAVRCCMESGDLAPLSFR